MLIKVLLILFFFILIIFIFWFAVPQYGRSCNYCRPDKSSFIGKRQPNIPPNHLITSLFVIQNEEKSIWNFQLCLTHVIVNSSRLAVNHSTVPARVNKMSLHASASTLFNSLKYMLCSCQGLQRHHQKYDVKDVTRKIIGAYSQASLDTLS